MPNLTHGSLFSGVGGFDFGFERAGIQTIWQVENDPYATKVLERHWPDVKRYGDIRKVDWEDVEVPDIVSGGFPCQPVSVAGKRKGTDDERWLWPEFARCLRVLRPRYAVLENVPGILAIGFGDVLGDLAGLGYDAEWDCIPAAAFGAPHLRYRVWVVAYADNERYQRPPQQRCSGKTIGAGSYVPNARSGGRGAGERDVLPRQPDAIRSGADVADALGNGGRGGIFRDIGNEGRRTGEAIRAGVQSRDGEARTDNAKPGGQDVADADGSGRQGRAGVFGPGRRGEFEDGGWWATEPGVGKLAYGISDRVGKLKCLGNAVVPQIAEWLANRIIEVDA